MRETIDILCELSPISTGGSSHRRSFGLPPDLLEKARNRVVRLALLMSVLFLGALGIMELIFSEEVNSSLVRTICLAVSGLSIALYVVARSKQVSHTTVLQIGLLYEIAFCFVISVGVPLFTHTNFNYVPHITWASGIIIVYPLIIPSPPLRTLITALCAAAMAPLGVFILDTARLVPADIGGYVGACISPGIAVALAVFGSRVVYGMNIDVARARKMGSYKLSELLGHGAMGEVWRASHRLLAREAAIKIIRPEVLKVNEDEARRILRRFEREAQATAALASPHTIEIYDFGITEEGIFYYVMELLDGRDLSSMVRKYGPLPSERVVHLLRQACHSLADAHAQGLIHRDIKPANIFACRKGLDHDFVKVLDFGMVRSKRNPMESDVVLTLEHAVMGTPAFMAPEMIRGEGDFDHRADIYCLGCVAYWLLTGQIVFEAKGAMDLMVEHVKSKPEPPSTRTEVAISSGLDEIVLSCLEKRPEDRPQSALQLSGMLAEVELSDVWTPSRAQEWWQIHLPHERDK